MELEEEDDTLPGVAVVDPAPVAPDRVPVVNKELPPLSTPWYGLTEGVVVFAASENLEKPLVWVPDPLVVEAPAAEAEAIPPEVRDVVEAPVNDGLRPPSPDIFR